MRSLGIIVAVLVAVALAGYVFISTHEFTAAGQPSRLEVYLARHIRRASIPRQARDMKNPTDESRWKEGVDHFREHCTTCHDQDGRGRTVIGRNVYPKVPDMTLADTQNLTDAELFYIISNGVRFTAMPAWGREDSPEEIWLLVDYIRRLPKLTPEERESLEREEHGNGEQHEHEDGAKPEPPHQHPH